jgi:hypothetical protein
MSVENPNLILVKSITTTYLNRNLPDPNTKLPKLIAQILENTKMPSDGIGEGGEGDINRALLITYEWLSQVPLTTKVDVSEIKERLIINCAFAADYMESIERALDVDYSDKDYIAERVKSVIQELEDTNTKVKTAAMLAKAHRKINFSAEHFNFNDFVAEIHEGLEEVKASASKMHEGFGGKVDFSDLDSIEETFEAAKESISTDGVLKTGLQGLNKMWGIGGYIRGGSYLYGALTHNYKTGILLDHCRWMTMYNTPRVVDRNNPNRKSMVLRISFENKPEQDLPILYRSIWEAEHQKKCDIAEVSAREAAQYIKDKLGANGIHFEMLCFDPNNMDIWDVITILQGYEAEGFEIQALIIDYLELITKKNTQQKRMDENIVYAYEVLRNYAFPRGITQINAHQLSTQAQELAREGTSNLAKKLAPGHYWMNCKSLATKVDGACVMHIHAIDDQKFLTFAWAKNRTSSDTSERSKFFAYKFEQYGGITDDVLAEKSRAVYEWASVTNDSTDTSADSDEDW